MYYAKEYLTTFETFLKFINVESFKHSEYFRKYEFFFSMFERTKVDENMNI
jgi:hypothetical protein